MNVLKNDYFTKSEVYLLALVFASLMLKHSISSWIMGVFVVFSIYTSITIKRKFKINRYLVIPICIYLFFIISTIWSHDLSQTIIGLGKTIILMILPITFSFNFRISKKQLVKIFSIFTYSNLFFGFLFILNAFIRFLKHKNTDVFFYHDFVNLLDLNAIYISSYFYISFVFLLFKQEKRKFDYLSIVILLIFITLLSSKIIIFISILSILIFIINVKKNQLKLIIIIPFLFYGFYFLSGNLLDRISTEFQTDLKEVLNSDKFTKVYPWTGTSIRVLQLRILKEQIENENILFNGFGLFASKKSLSTNHKRLNTYPGFHSYNYHNTYAQMISELGLIGLSLLILNLFFLFKLSIIKKHKWFVLISMMFCIWFFTESVLWVQRGLFIFTLIYCIVVKIDKNHLKFNYSSGS